MGIYVNISDNRGYQIASGKYGVGFAILMFSRFKKTKTKFLFVAEGAEAILNLEKYLAYIHANMTDENEARLLPIEHQLYDVRSKIKENNVYSLDYTEIMSCIHNPSYNPMRPIIETAEKIDDAIWGYNRFGCKDTVAIKIMLAYLQSIDPQIYISSVVREQKHNFVFTANICESDDDKHHIDTILLRTSDDVNWQIDEYYQRKMFMILKKAGLEFEYLVTENRTAYILIDKNYMQKIVDTKPFVVVSYRWDTTYDIHQLIPNNPEAKEKLYSYLKAQDSAVRKIKSIVIDGTELIGMTADEVSKYIGTAVTFANYCFCDLVTYDL